MSLSKLGLHAAILAICIAVSSPSVAHHPVDPLEQAPTAPAAGADPESVNGTVHELIVNDHVAGMTVRHVSIVAADGLATALRGDAAAALAKGVDITATGRRNGGTLFVESVATRKAAPVAAAAADDRVTGRLMFIHADDFDSGKTSYHYEVHGDDGRVTGLKLHIQPETLQAGMKIAASGTRLAESGDLEATAIDIYALPETTDPTAGSPTALEVTTKATTTHSVLVTLLKFSDTSTDPMPVLTAQQVMSTNADSVTKYFKEASYGQHQLNVTVTSSWLRSATLKTPTSCTSTQWSQIQQAADAAAKAAGYTATYEYHVYIFPRVAACGWSGLAYIANPKWAFINGAGAVATKVIAHEMGHNFGLMHAASVDCGAAVIGGACSVSEYGDGFNTMGMGNSMHYAAAQKYNLGWIASGAVKVHTSGTATYTINPLELAGGTTYAVKIPVATRRTYWLEYRQPLGFDAGLSSYPTNGVQIRLGLPFETTCSGCNNDTQFLDLTPSTSMMFDGALTVGKTFKDPQYGTTISVLSASATGVSVQVSSTGATPPGLVTTTTALSSSVNPAVTGATVTFTATVTGSSPTGTVVFKKNGTALSGCTAVALAGTGNARTATCSTSALSIGTNAMVASYSGNSANASSSSATVTQTVSALPPASTNVALASVGASATASSTYSNSYQAANVINNERTGINWGGGRSGWQDATANSYPDWVQVNFNGSKTISKVVVYSKQDSTTPVEPSSTLTFTKYGVKDFTVQGWNGTSWVTLGTVTANNLVKRTVSFTAFKTDRIRINVSKAVTMWTSIVEVEAWGS
jgi:M6 family metalloprotease-like protein